MHRLLCNAPTSRNGTTETASNVLILTNRDSATASRRVLPSEVGKPDLLAFFCVGASAGVSQGGAAPQNPRAKQRPARDNSSGLRERCLRGLFCLNTGKKNGT